MLDKDVEKIQSAETKATEIVKQAHLQIDTQNQKLKQEIQDYKIQKQSSYEQLRSNLYKETDLIVLKYKEDKTKELKSSISKIKNLTHSHSEKSVNFIIDSLIKN